MKSPTIAWQSALPNCDCNHRLYPGSPITVISTVYLGNRADHYRNFQRLHSAEPPSIRQHFTNAVCSIWRPLNSSGNFAGIQSIRNNFDITAILWRNSDCHGHHDHCDSLEIKCLNEALIVAG